MKLLLLTFLSTLSLFMNHLSLWNRLHFSCNSHLISLIASFPLASQVCFNLLCFSSIFILCPGMEFSRVVNQAFGLLFLEQINCSCHTVQSKYPVLTYFYLFDVQLALLYCHGWCVSPCVWHEASSSQFCASAEPAHVWADRICTSGWATSGEVWDWPVSKISLLFSQQN